MTQSDDTKGTPRDLWKIVAFWVVFALAAVLYAYFGLRGMIQQHIDRAAPPGASRTATP